ASAASQKAACVRLLRASRKASFRGRRRPYALQRALHDARPPGLVLVGEPDELGLERTHPQLALGVRLLELAEPNRHVAADDDRTPARLDEDALVPVRVPGRWQHPDSR